jgi:hypothetical protein
VNRERIVRLALRSYPRDVRASKGSEMVGTLLDSSARSDAALARELVDLVRRGLSARATSTARVGARRLIADGLCCGGILLIAELLYVRLGVYPGGQLAVGAAGTVELGLLAAGLVLALVGYDRAGATCALSCFAVLTGVRWSVVARPGSILLPDLVILIVCFAPMLITPRRRRPDLRRLAWLVVIAALGAVAALGAAFFDAQRGGLGALYLPPVLVALPFALALLPTDPRLAIACSLVAAFVGLVGIAQTLQNGLSTVGIPVIVLVLIAAPIVICIASARTRSLRRRDPA